MQLVICAHLWLQGNLSLSVAVVSGCALNLCIDPLKMIQDDRLWTPVLTASHALRWPPLNTCIDRLTHLTMTASEHLYWPPHTPHDDRLWTPVLTASRYLQKNEKIKSTEIDLFIRERQR